MKRLFFFTVLIPLLFSCEKDEIQDSTSQLSAYAQRLEGDWQLQGVEYNGEIPNPLDPTTTIPVEGVGTSVSGGHSITTNPNTIDFNYLFTAEVVFNNIPIPVPVEQTGSGEWTLSESEDHIFVTEDGETVAWEVLVNEETEQVYKADIPVLLQGFTVLIETEFTFVK